MNESNMVTYNKFVRLRQDVDNNVFRIISFGYVYSQHVNAVLTNIYTSFIKNKPDDAFHVLHVHELP